MKRKRGRGRHEVCRMASREMAKRFWEELGEGMG